MNVLNDTNCAWINDLTPRSNINILKKNKECQWLIIGAGYTGLSAAITPSSTSNKILIMVNQHCFAAGDGGGSMKILRDSTSIYTPGESYAFYFDGASIDARQYHSFNYLDSPSSTSAITYKTQGRAYNSNAFKTQNGGYFTSFITLMEVAA